MSWLTGQKLSGRGSPSLRGQRLSGRGSPSRRFTGKTHHMKFHLGLEFVQQLFKFSAKRRKIFELAREKGT